MDTYEKKYKEALERARKAYNAIKPENYGARKIIENAFPELRESEGERIRKKIIDIVKAAPFDEEKDVLLDYLEKQKDFADNEYWRGFGNGRDEVIDNPDMFNLQEKQKEQKPAEKQDYSGLNELERAILRGFLCADVENVSVTIIKETAQDCLAQMWDKLQEEFRNINEAFEDGKKEVVAHPEKYNLCKPAEWSEEDEKIVKFYEDDYDNNLGNMPMRDVIENRIKFKDWLLNRLKSLRPSWKPSMLQMQAMKLFVEKHRDTANQLIGGWPSFEAFESLYNDLLKLM